MNEAIAKAVTDVLIDLKLSNTLERLQKIISTPNDRIVALEKRPTPDEDVNNDSNTDRHLPEDEVFDADGNVD
jgi:hypothetical protein